MAERADGVVAVAEDGRPIVGEIGLGNLVLFLGRLRRTFANWPAIFCRLVLSSLGVRGGDIVSRARTGPVLVCPALRAAWWPVYEMLAEDLYHLGSLRDLELGAGEVVLDIGAHVGAAALALGRRFPAARLLCVEPNPAACAYLERNLSANGLAAEIRQVAVGGGEGTVTLYGAERASCEASTTFVRPGGRRQVEMVPFSRLVREAAGPVRVVKLDCEGAEHAIAAATPGDLWETVELVLLEYHTTGEPGATFESLAAYLGELGFETCWEVPFAWRPGLGMAAFRRAQRRR